MQENAREMQRIRAYKMNAIRSNVSHPDPLHIAFHACIRIKGLKHGCEFAAPLFDICCWYSFHPSCWCA